MMGWPKGCPTILVNMVNKLSLIYRLILYFLQIVKSDQYINQLFGNFWYR